MGLRNSLLELSPYAQEFMLLKGDGNRGKDKNERLWLIEIENRGFALYLLVYFAYLEFGNFFFLVARFK